MTTNENQSACSRTAEATENELGVANSAALRAARAVKSAVCDGADAIAEAARVTYGRAAEGISPSKLADALRGIVRDHPLAALATVATTSVLVGRWLTRR